MLCWSEHFINIFWVFNTNHQYHTYWANFWFYLQYHFIQKIPSPPTEENVSYQNSFIQVLPVLHSVNHHHHPLACLYHLLIFIWSQMWSHTLNIHLTPCHSIGITKLKNCLANQCISRKERNSVFCMNWEIKHSWESGHTVSLSMGSVGHQEAKPFKKLQYLAWN